MMRRKYTRAHRRTQAMRLANEARDDADKMARRFNGCDDPDWPRWPERRTGQYVDWMDFVEQVARPIIESNDEAVVQDAMRLYREECPRFICNALVQAVDTIEGRLAEIEAELYPHRRP